MVGDGLAEGLAARVPAMVHQTWTSAQVPRQLESYIASWRRLMPGWTYMLHTDADNEKLVDHEYSWLSPSYRGMSAIQRADLARYMYMHHYGGVYVRPAPVPLDHSTLLNTECLVDRQTLTCACFSPW